MFRSRPLQVLLLLTFSVTAVPAKPPNAVFGAGVAVTCKAYVTMLKDHDTVRLTDVLLAWVQGYFSARNTAGRGNNLLTVGGTISSDTLRSMLADQCREEGMQRMEVFFAAEALYEKLQAKGL